MAEALFEPVKPVSSGSLDQREFIDFLEALKKMPWSWQNKATAPRGRGE
jgi:hypothetical protein